MKTNDIKTAVLELLKNEGISYTVTTASENIDRDGWQCDGWRVTFTKNDKSEAFDYFTGLGHRKASRERECIRPVKPYIAGVLHSLISDSGAVDTCFIDWTNDYGYDSDSIKALTIYNLCCENTKRLKRIFSRATLAALSEMLQDY